MQSSIQKQMDQAVHEKDFCSSIFAPEFAEKFRPKIEKPESFKNVDIDNANFVPFTPTNHSAEEFQPVVMNHDAAPFIPSVDPGMQK